MLKSHIPNISLDKPLSIDLLLEIRCTWKILGSLDFLKFLKSITNKESNKKAKLNTQIYIAILNSLCTIGEEEFTKKIIGARSGQNTVKKYDQLDLIVLCVCEHFQYDYAHLIDKKIREKRRTLALTILSLIALDYKYNYLEIGTSINRSATRINTFVSTFVKMKSNDNDKKFIEENIEIIKQKIKNG